MITLTPPAARLLRRCLFLICVYLVAVALCAERYADTPRNIYYLTELCKSAYIALLLSVGGSLLLDLCLREKK